MVWAASFSGPLQNTSTMRNDCVLSLRTYGYGQNEKFYSIMTRSGTD
jgi:hypothetical protein